jgi:hypothetical protein
LRSPLCRLRPGTRSSGSRSRESRPFLKRRFAGRATCLPSGLLSGLLSGLSAPFAARVPASSLAQRSRRSLPVRAGWGFGGGFARGARRIRSGRLRHKAPVGFKEQAQWPWAASCSVYQDRTLRPSQPPQRAGPKLVSTNCGLRRIQLETV